MSFWNGVKRAFGFSQEIEGEEEDYTSALPTYAVTTPPVPVTPPAVTPVTAETPEPERQEEKGQSDVEEPRGEDTDLPVDLFDSILEVFNAAQPEFVRKCLSLDSQRAYLIESISEKLRNRLAAGSKVECDETLRRRIRTLEEDAKRNEELRGDNNKLRLSLTRQKRALLDRINDLEAQVVKLNEDKEKFFASKQNPADAETIARNAERIAELESEVAALNGRIEEKDRSADEPDPRVAELEKELERQTALREQLEMKSRMSDEMLTELRNSAASARQDLERVTAEREEATQLLAEQLDGFERVKERLEARVKDLQDQLEAEKSEDKAGRIAKLNEENASLRHTIENNLYNQANNEMRLRKEIKTLTARITELEQLASTPVTVAEPVAREESVAESPAPAAPRRRGRPRKARIDADLDNPEWFSSGATSKKDDPDFGYHEPPRRPSNDNEAQLSLF